MKNIFIYCLLLILCSSMSCVKSDKCIVRPKYYFQLPIVTSPMDSVYNIGDRITFEINYSDTLTETKTGERLYLPNFDFKPEFHITNIGISPYKDALPNFIVSSLIGGVSRVPLGDSLFASPITFSNSNGRKIARFSLTPRSVGIYSISIVSYVSDYIVDNWRGVQVKGVCEREEFWAQYVNVSQLNTNYFYIQRSPDATVRSVTDYIARSNGYFCFRVR